VAAAAAAAGRSASARMTMPLPSQESTSTSSSVPAPGGGVRVGVEGVDVDRGAGGEHLDLAFAQPLPGGPLDPGHRVVEGAAGGFHRREPAQPVRVALGAGG